MAVGHGGGASDPGEAIATAIEQGAALAGASPQAGIMFSAFDSMAAAREALPGVSIMGSTWPPRISSVDGFEEDPITLALFASDSVDVTVGWARAWPRTSTRPAAPP